MSTLSQITQTTTPLEAWSALLAVLLVLALALHASWREHRPKDLLKKEDRRIDRLHQEEPTAVGQPQEDQPAWLTPQWETAP